MTSDDVTSIFWHEIPFVRIAIPFIAGILIWQQSQSPLAYLIAPTVGLVILGTSVLAHDIRVRQQLRTLALSGMVFGAGAFVRYLAEPDPVSIVAASAVDSPLMTTVLSTTPKPYGSKATLRIIPTVGSILHGKTDVIAYVRDSNRVLKLGDTLITTASPERIPAPTNPFAFDIAGFYRNQGIHLRMWVNADEVILHKSAVGFGFRRACADIRDTLSGVIRTHISDQQISGVLEAMVLGIRNGLDDELTDAYAKSGAIHILAISGLHVGIISFILFALIGRVRRKNSTAMRIFRVVVLLSGIWCFAAIAGLSPSVTRAASMFSIYLIGIMIQRSVKGLNVLACTALIFLSIDPLQINSVSFQFSYLALAGILIFYRPIHRLLILRSRPGRIIWSTVVISIAAQLFLLPFMIYYFHQVSLISLLSGLVAIPAAYIILCSGLALFLLHFIITPVAEFWAQILEHLVGWTNQLMRWLSELPMSHVSDLFLPGLEIGLLFCIAVCVALRILTRHRWWFFTACLFGIALCIGHQTSVRAARHLERIAIYCSKAGQLGIDYISDGTCYSTLDISGLNPFLESEIKMFRHLSGARQTLHIPVSDTLACIGLLTLPCRIDSTGLRRIAVIKPQCAQHIESGILNLLPDQVLLSPGIFRKTRTDIARVCESNNIPVHDFYRDGTFYLTYHTATNETSWQNISR